MKVELTPTGPADRSGVDGDSELLRVIEGYLSKLEAGCAPPEEQLLAEHPLIAGRIRDCLGGLQLIEHAADGLPEPTFPSEELAEPRRLGDYRLIREVGRGGMGIVYEAEQVSLGRRVALKVLPFAAATDPKHLRRFQVEAQAAAYLQHPHIVPVHGVGCERGVHYYAMQLIDGRTVADFVGDLRRINGMEPRGPDTYGLSLPDPTPGRAPLLPAPEEARRAAGSRGKPDLSSKPAVNMLAAFLIGASARDRSFFRLVARLGKQAAEALEHAHQQGVLHRDIKPSNLLLDLQGKLWVTDFGLARFKDDHELTGSGDLVGTLRYMSPEQAQGSQRIVVDHRTDVYSLGVTLYEMLSLSPAFEGRDRAEVLRRVIHEEPKALRRLNLMVPIDLATIVGKAMEKDPQSRYGSAEDLAEDLGRFLEARPIKARPAGAFNRWVKWARRHRAAMATAASFALVAAMGLAVLAVWRDGMLRRHNHALKASLAIVEREVRTNRRLLYGSQVRLAQQELVAGQVEFAQEALERLRPAQGEPDLRGFEWHYLRRLAHRDISVLFGHETSVLALDISQDGRSLVSGDKHGVIVFWDLDAWRESGRASGQGRAGGPLEFSPDGRVVVSTCGEWPDQCKVKLWDPATAHETAQVPGIKGNVVRPAFSHDGRTLLVWEHGNGAVGIDDKVTFWGISPNRTLAAGDPPRVACAFFAVSPDRRLCVTAGLSGLVTLRETSSGNPRLTLPRRFSRIQALAFTPDGRSILVETQDGVTFLDVATGKEEGRIDASPQDPVNLTMSVTLTPGLPLQRGTGLSMTGSRPPLRLTSLEGGLNGLMRFQFSPDGRILAGTGGPQPPVLWDTATGKLRTGYQVHGEKVDALDFTPNGKSLIFGCADARIRTWDLEKGREPLDRLAGHEAEVWALAYTPDGGTLASAADDHKIRLWDPRTGALRKEMTGHPSLVTSLAISPDGTTLASGGYDTTVRLWDLQSGRERSILKGHTDRVRGVAFSPGGRQLASCASDGTVRLWDAVDGRELGSLQRHVDGLHDLAFNRNGTRLVTAGNDSTLRVWDLDSSHDPLTIPGLNPNTALAFSSDGTFLASGDDGGNVDVWDSSTWTRTIAIKGSDAPIWELAFSPDGRTLAAACGDAKVRLWDPVTGQLTLVLDGHLQRVNAVAFSPDGSTLASASHDGAIKLWHAERP